MKKPKTNTILLMVILLTGINLNNSQLFIHYYQQNNAFASYKSILADDVIYEAGNGYDLEALDFMNIFDGQNIRSSLDLDVSVAILDSGLQEDAWNYLEAKFDVDITYVDVVKNIWGNLVIRTTTDSSDSRVKDHGDFHGTMMASIIAQTAPTVNILAIDVHKPLSPYKLDTKKIKKALEWLLNDGSPRANIISMSYSGAYDSGEESLLSMLHSSGVELFASTGNKEDDSWWNPKYPASYSSVHSIGTIFDDTDGKFEDSQINQHESKAIIESRSRDIRIAYGSGFVWGYTANEFVKFLAPGFDFEVNVWEGSTRKNMIIDGTSISTPFAAGIAAYVLDIYIDLGYAVLAGQSGPSALGQTGNDLISSAEGSSCDYPSCDLYYHYTLNRPTPNNYIHGSFPEYIDGIGYGILDVYDAMMSAIQRDYEDPVIEITYPYDGSTVGGTISFQASASDNLDIDYVKFYIGSTLLKTDYSYPYSASLYTTSYPNGWYTLKATSYDLKGNTDTHSISIYIYNSSPICKPGYPC